MPGTAAAYLFLLGLACGIGLLTMTAYLQVTPAWLKWLLLATGAFVMSRYIAMFVLATATSPGDLGLLRHCWFATSLGLTLQSTYAVDQLVRHPAMTPRKVLLWYSPFLAVYAAVILFGGTVAVPDRVLGWTLRLTRPWQAILSLTHTVFVIVYLGTCALLMRKIPVRPIRLGLAGLILGQLALTVDGAILALGGWYFRPYVFSEMLMLIVLWHAFRTGPSLP